MTCLSKTLFLTLLLVLHVLANKEIYDKCYLKFTRMDANEDQLVDPEEVRGAYSSMRSWDASAFFIEADSNEDGLIDLEEWTNVCTRWMNKEVKLSDHYFY